MPDLINLYLKRAKKYDITATLHFILGFGRN
jgi:hypothetical protein